MQSYEFYLQYFQRQPGEMVDDQRRRVLFFLAQQGVLVADVIQLGKSINRGPECLASLTIVNAEKRKQWVLAHRAVSLVVALLCGILTYGTVVLYQDGETGWSGFLLFLLLTSIYPAVQRHAKERSPY
jgi:hypothetical protein